ANFHRSDRKLKVPSGVQFSASDILQLARICASNTTMRPTLLVIESTLCIFLAILVPHASAADSADPVVDALHASLSKNAEHARNWLDERDFKSLAQSAGRLEMLGELLRARSDDDAWQSATTQLIVAAKLIETTARTENVSDCRAAIQQLLLAQEASQKVTAQ